MIRAKKEDMPMTEQAHRPCPYLGLFDESSIIRSSPAKSHRCYAQRPASAIDVEFQNEFCLHSEHVNCTYYKKAHASGLASAQEAVPAQVSRKRRRLGLAALLSLLVLSGLAAIIFTGGVRFLSTPDLSNLPVIQVWPTQLPATPSPRPSPTTKPTATDNNALLAVSTSIDANPISQGDAVQGDAVQEADQTTPDATVSPEGSEAAENGASAGSQTATATPSPTPADKTLVIQPKAGEVGWWTDGDSRRNHLGDSYLYVGDYEGQTYIAAARFNLSRVARGAPIRAAAVRLTGLRDDRFAADAGGAWLVQLIAENALEEMGRADFLTAYSAPASITLPLLSAAELGEKEVNELTLEDAAISWLEQQLLDGAQSVTLRVLPNPEGGDNLFAWDSGQGPKTAGNAPELELLLGPPPPTPPPLPTKPFIVATLTPVPDNIVTVVAMANTATAVAEVTGTYTPVPYDVYTPTPFPENLATVQAAALIQELPPVVLETPVPANDAESTAIAEYATAVALTTGTFTPVPADFVTPVLILPSPPAENVATAAARVVKATQIAADATLPTSTPLPYNAILAEYVYATKPPENAATAAAQQVLAQSKAQVEGTPTRLPWNAVVITRVPPPAATPVPLLISSANFTPTPTASPLPPDVLPNSLRNKIVFKSNRSGQEATYVMDPATGAVSLVTQSWVFPLAARQLGAAPDGRREAIVERDDNRVHQIKVRNYEYGTTRKITNLKNMTYDPAWSPVNDQIVFVSTDVGNDEIYIIDANSGGDPVRLTYNDWEWDKHPSWSPDGSQIVFYSNRGSGRRQLWMMNADGTNVRNISNNEWEDWDPVWTR